MAVRLDVFKNISRRSLFAAPQARHFTLTQPGFLPR